MKIIFVGSNPSNASKTILPFYGDTKSDKILKEWLRQMPAGIEISVCNVSDKKTINNTALSIIEITHCLPDLRSKIGNHNKVIALGKTAAKALHLLNIDFFEMPHPSPRNRLNNDPNFVKDKVENLIKYVQE